MGIEGIRLAGFPSNVYTDASGYYSVVVPTGSYTITPIDSNGQWTFNPPSFSCGSGDLIQNVTGTALECLNAKDGGYNAWISTRWNKPACWCHRRQCRGDVDGAKHGFWVYTSDMNIFKSAYGKSDAVLATVPNGICANFSHFKSATRVYTWDLNVLKSYYGKTETQVPECNRPPYGMGIIKINKWTN
jgi:hypothetical protein